MSIAANLPLDYEAVASRPSRGGHGRMLQLDGIRGLAVLGVLMWHWLPEYCRYCPIGVVAVRVFFALSGFLITGILLKARDEHDELKNPWWTPVRHFYIRRVLRIFPLYYMVLFLILAGGVPEARQNAAWHLSYMSNFLSAWRGELGGSTGHFWSLAVEEQFYMVWPWLVLFMPRRGIIWAIGAMILVGPVYRLGACMLWPHNYHAATVIPLGCLDSLGAGALLAWAKRGAKQRPALYQRLSALGGLIGLPVLALGLFLYNRNNMGMGWVVLTDLGVALSAAWLISAASSGIRGPVGWFLELPPLLYMGTISYCVYILHPFIHNITPRLFAKLHMAAPPHMVEVAVNFGLTLILATASWYLFEKRMIGLGRKMTPETVRR